MIDCRKYKTRENYKKRGLSNYKGFKR